MKRIPDLVANLGEVARRRVFRFFDAARRAPVGAQQAELDLAQRSSPESLRDWQSGKLHALLNHARDSVEFYRSLVPSSFSLGESWAVLESLPVVSRGDLEAAPEAFLSRRYKRFQLYAGFTSGSVGHAVAFWTDRARRRRVVAELAYFGGWAGYQVGMRHVFLRQTMPESTKGRLRLWPKNQVLYNTSVLNEQKLREILDLFETSRARILFAYPWTLHTLALYMSRNSRVRTRHSIESVISLGGAWRPGPAPWSRMDSESRSSSGIVPWRSASSAASASDMACI